MHSTQTFSFILAANGTFDIFKMKIEEIKKCNEINSIENRE